MPYNEHFYLTQVGPLFKSRYAQAGRIVGDDPGYAVWPARVQADIDAGLNEAASLAKHDQELCQALGIVTPTPVPPTPSGPFPAPPSRDAILNGQTTQQGLTITTTQFGSMPWWGACWAWLTPADRQVAAQQLLAAGDTICLIERPSGVPLYNEGGQFYSPDKFGPLSMSDTDFVALIEETLLLGFAGVWVFLGGDDGANGYPIAIAQTSSLSPALAASSRGNLNQYVVQLPGWDGVFYGYTPEQVESFAAMARGAGALYVGMEHSTGHIPLGEGGDDYQPGGRMKDFDLILGEFDDDRFDDSVWQILGRMLPHYVRPAAQPLTDDPTPPYYLSTASPRGPFVYRVFEYLIYGWVRGVTADHVAANKAQFVAMGATHIC